MPRPAVAIALPREEFGAVSVQLSEAGFEPIEVASADDLEELLRVRRDVGLAILDSETDFDKTIEMYGLLHDEGRSIPALMVVAAQSMERMRLGAAGSGDEYFSRPYYPDSLRWRVEAMLIRAEVKSKAASETAEGSIIESELKGTAPEEAHHGRVVVIFNPKGGVGKTTIAVNLSAALQVLVGQRVLLIDCDTVTGHIASSLGLEDVRTVVDAWTEDLETGKNESFADIARIHRNGVSVLVMAQSPLHTEILDAKRVAEAITAARRPYNWVLVDMHPDYGPLNQGIFELADRIIVPVTPDVPCLRAACQFVDVARDLGISDHLVLVVNRANSGVSVADVERVVGMPAMARVRSAGMLFMKAANEGQSAVERFPRAKVVGDIEGLAERLMGSMDPKARMGTGLVRLFNRAWSRRKPGRSLARKKAPGVEKA